jgi:hypothetical protein
MRITSKLAIMAVAGMVLSFTPLRAQTDPPPQTPPVAQQQDTQGQTWSGTLADADCKATTPTEKCEVSDITRNFGLLTSAGKFVRLDDSGNEKVRTALQSAKQKTGSISAMVRGQMDGDTIKVDSVQIH